MFEEVEVTGGDQQGTDVVTCLCWKDDSGVTAPDKLKVVLISWDDRNK